MQDFISAQPFLPLKWQEKQLRWNALHSFGRSEAIRQNKPGPTARCTPAEYWERGLPAGLLSVLSTALSPTDKAS